MKSVNFNKFSRDSDLKQEAEMEARKFSLTNMLTRLNEWEGCGQNAVLENPVTIGSMSGRLRRWDKSNESSSQQNTLSVPITWNLIYCGFSYLSLLFWWISCNYKLLLLFLISLGEWLSSWLKQTNVRCKWIVSDEVPRPSAASATSASSVTVLQLEKAAR